MKKYFASLATFIMFTMTQTTKAETTLDLTPPADEITIEIENLSVPDNKSDALQESNEPIQISFEFEPVEGTTDNEEWKAITKTTQALEKNAEHSGSSYESYQAKVNALIPVIQSLTRLQSFKGAIAIIIGEISEKRDEEISENTAQPEMIRIAFEFKKNEQTDKNAWAKIAGTIAKKAQQSDHTYQSFIERTESLIQLIQDTLKLNAFAGSISVTTKTTTETASKSNFEGATQKDEIRALTLYLEAAREDGYSQEEWDKLVKLSQDLIAIIKSKEHKFSTDVRQSLLEEVIKRVLEKSFSYGISLQ